METISITDCPIAQSWHEVVLHCLVMGSVYTYSDNEDDYFEEELFDVMDCYFQAEAEQDGVLSLWDDPEDSGYIFHLAPPHDEEYLSKTSKSHFEFRLDASMYDYLNKQVRDVVRDLRGKILSFKEDEE